MLHQKNKKLFQTVSTLAEEFLNWENKSKAW